VPVPVIGIVHIGPPFTDWNRSWVLRVPVAVGVNVMETGHVPPTGIGLVQLFV